MAVFENARAEQMESIFVCEDDMHILDNVIVDDVSVPIREYMESIVMGNVEWDIILLGCNPQKHMIPVTKHFAIDNKSTGAWAYIIKKPAYEYILDNLHYLRDRLAIDDYLPKMNQLGFTALTVTPMAINHATGFESTLQPNGLVDYNQWIDGNYQKHYYAKTEQEKQIASDITVIILGRFDENYTAYVIHLVNSLPKELRGCRILLNYVYVKKTIHDTKLVHLSRLLHDMYPDIFFILCSTHGESAIEKTLTKTKTPYYIVLNHNSVIVDEIDFDKMIAVCGGGEIDISEFTIPTNPNYIKHNTLTNLGAHYE